MTIFRASRNERAAQISLLGMEDNVYRAHQQNQARAFMARINEAKAQAEARKRGPKPKPPKKRLTELQFIGRKVSSPGTLGRTRRALSNLANKPLTKNTSVPRRQVPEGQRLQVQAQKHLVFPSKVDLSEEKRFEVEPRRDSTIIDIYKFIEQFEEESQENVKIIHFKVNN